MTSAPCAARDCQQPATVGLYCRGCHEVSRRTAAALRERLGGRDPLCAECRAAEPGAEG